MPSRKPLRRLRDILDHVVLIETFTAGMTFDVIAADIKAVMASLHALVIISEAATKLGATADDLVPGQPWQAIRSLGNVLRHDYDAVDPRTVWRVIASGDLASLKASVADAIARLDPSPQP